MLAFACLWLTLVKRDQCCCVSFTVVGTLVLWRAGRGGVDHRFQPVVTRCRVHRWGRLHAPRLGHEVRLACLLCCVGRSVLKPCVHRAIASWNRGECLSAEQTIEEHSTGVCALQASPHVPHLLVSGSYDETVKVWDTRNMSKSLATAQCGGGVWRLKFHPNPDHAVRALLRVRAAC